MNLPPVVSETEWQAAQDVLLAKEKDATRARDALAAERRRLPRVHIEKEYVFDGPEGKETLADLFDGRSQLVVYHFMFPPEDDEGCPSCSFWADSFDANVIHREGMSVFYRDAGGDVFHTYSAYARGIDILNAAYNYLDLVPKGRDEEARGPLFWVRRRDEYGDGTA